VYLPTGRRRAYSKKATMPSTDTTKEAVKATLKYGAPKPSSYWWTAIKAHSAK